MVIPAPVHVSSRLCANHHEGCRVRPEVELGQKTSKNSGADFSHVLFKIFWIGFRVEKGFPGLSYILLFLSYVWYRTATSLMPWFAAGNYKLAYLTFNTAHFRVKCYATCWGPFWEAEGNYPSYKLSLKVVRSLKLGVDISLDTKDQDSLWFGFVVGAKWRGVSDWMVPPNK